MKVVQAKLPELDETVLNLDDAALRLFNASRFGEWLNQDIYCGTIVAPPVTVPCLPLPNANAANAAAKDPGMSSLIQLIGARAR